MSNLKELPGYPSYVFEEFSDKLGKILEPIELADNGHIAIVKDEEGKIYAIDGSVLFYVVDLELFEFIKILELD